MQNMQGDDFYLNYKSMHTIYAAVYSQKFFFNCKYPQSLLLESKSFNVERYKIDLCK